MGIKYSKVLYQPQSEPVTVDEAKTHLRVTDNAEDSYIENLIKTARRMCERYAGISFITQTRVVKLDAFPYCSPYEIELPYGPVLSMSGNDSATSPNALGVSYINDAGAGATTTTLVLNTDFYLDSNSDIPRISPVDTWPTDVDSRINAVTITYTAGHEDADSVPPEAKQAILLQVGSLYENRQDDTSGSVDSVCWNSTALLDNIKVYYNARQD